MMNYQEKEAQLDIYDVKKALLYRKAIGETEWDRITVMALKELLEYKKIGLMPQEIKELHEAYFEIRGSKGHVSYVAGVDEEAGDVDSMYNLVLQRH